MTSRRNAHSTDGNTNSDDLNMTPIRCICPDCLTEFADALERLPGEGKALLNAYCVHHGVALSARIGPGLVIEDWGMFPAASEAEAQRKVQTAQLQEELIAAALADMEKAH